MDDFIKEKKKQLLEHKHPLHLIDLWSEQLKHEEEHEEDEEENEDELIAKQAFRCLCFRCEEEINWFHRYYYTCSQCDHSSHKFCMEFPERLEEYSPHAHTLYLRKSLYSLFSPWCCNICHNRIYREILSYHCHRCDFHVGICCATKSLKKNIIHHPSHKHPLTCIPKQILCECDACGKEHKGFFYQCYICHGPFIHSHCAFLPEKLQIQQTTNDDFFHIHPLTIAYSFAEMDHSIYSTVCRVCLQPFRKRYLWIYKCEKCRYYTHLDCATSRNEPFMSILAAPDAGKIKKNYKDVEHPDVVHLPFPDPSYSILKHWFFKKDGSSKFEVNKDTVNSRISHQHPLILEDARCTDITSSSTPSRMKRISYHDPMKRTELLCNGCLRPITTAPIYVCADEDEHCNFALHEWCSRLRTEVKDHQDHPQHTLILHSKAPNKFFGVFNCDICGLPCNGFVYCCEECKYYIDVNCAFLPKEVTHTCHPNHLFSLLLNRKKIDDICRICKGRIWCTKCFSFSCYNCDIHLHPQCALLIPETTTHKCDKHPLKLSFLPIENHKSEYFCEICEEELNPNNPFYHCHECMQSMHLACAPSIIRYETCPGTYDFKGIYEFVNVKFEGTYSNTKLHPHPLSFIQGVESDGNCDKCGDPLRYNMIFKCLHCKFAIDIDCCRRLFEYGDHSYGSGC